ncbi:MAG: tetratricopeptide repeat protein, partial [Proteobacteria bacterium]|nr:tetratricopeptide repeat protein [Burkholderiales bacterium]
MSTGRNDDASTPWVALGLSLEALQRGDEALACYGRALEDDPNDREALWHLVRFGARCRDLVVEPASQVVLALSPPDLPLLKRVGIALASTRWTALALECLALALADSSDVAAGPGTDSIDEPAATDANDRAIAHAMFGELLANARRPREA